MNFKGTPNQQRPGAVCGNRGPRSTCPPGCVHPASRICGNGCSGLMAQQLPPNEAACWNLGSWAGGKEVSISLYSARPAALACPCLPLAHGCVPVLCRHARAAEAH